MSARGTRMERPPSGVWFPGLLAMLWAAPLLGQTVIVDDADSGFTVLSGTWTWSDLTAGHYGTGYRYRVTTGSGSSFGEVEFRPDLPSAGAYEVSVWYTQGTNRAPDAPYTVHYNSGSQTVYVDQQATGSQWVVLGTFSFSAGTTGRVTLSNDAAPTVVIADAVRFEAQGPAPPEFRAFWADAFHSGFKSTSEIDTMINWALTGNYNAIMPEVLAHQDSGSGGHGAYWNSNIVPKASDISGGIDPLAYLVQQAHANGLEVHPWLVAFRVSSSWPPNGNSTVAAHPEWLMVPYGDMGGGPAKVGSYYTFDPGSPDVQDYLMSIVRELVANYEIDGIHWDYIRYTQTDAGYPADSNYAKSTLRRFQDITGYVGVPPDGEPSWDDFRRRTVTELVRRGMFEVPSIDNPRQPLRYTAALVTWYPPPPSGDFHQTRPYYDTFSDWEYWHSMGYLDSTMPMCYFDEGSYPNTYRSWVNNCVTWANAYNRHTYIGPGIYMNSFADSETQMLYAQGAGADGLCTYSYRTTNDDGQTWSDWYSYVTNNVFPEPVPTPTMPWRDPSTAAKGAVYGRVADGATGEPIDDAQIDINGADSGIRTDGAGYYLITKQSADASGTIYSVGASYPGYADVVRPAVLVERAGFTEANLGLGAWLSGDYDVDGDADLDDYAHFAGCLTSPDGGTIAAGCDLFDFDADDDVDFADFAVFQAAFTGA